MQKRLIFILAVLVLSVTPAVGVAQDDNAPSGTLRYAVNVVLSNMNPWYDGQPAFLAAYHIPYEGLLIEDNEGNVVPMLAESYEYNDDLTVLTMDIIEGVVFHDGTPFNAEVAAANLNYIKESVDFPPTQTKMAAFESAEATDETTLVITLSRPDIAFINNLARNIGIMLSPNTWEDQFPVGSGPYRIVVEESVLDGTLLFEAFSDYRDPSQQGVAQIKYLQIPDQNARLNALLSGDVDIVSLPAALADAAADGGANLLVAPSVVFGLQVLDLNGEMVPQLADREFRCAISQSIDRQALTDVLNRGYSLPVTQLKLPDQYGYIADAPNTGFNPEAAAAVLSEHSGLTLSTGSWGPFNVISQVAAGALSEYGITLEVEQIQSNQMWSSLAQGVYPIATIPYPEANIITELQSRGIDGPRNPSGVVPDGVADLLAQAEVLPADEAEPLLAEAHRIMIDECIWIPVFYDLGVAAANPNVIGAEKRALIPVAVDLRGVRLEG